MRPAPLAPSIGPNLGRFRESEARSGLTLTQQWVGVFVSAIAIEQNATGRFEGKKGQRPAEIASRGGGNALRVA